MYSGKKDTMPTTSRTNLRFQNRQGHTSSELCRSNVHLRHTEARKRRRLGFEEEDRGSGEEEGVKDQMVPSCGECEYSEEVSEEMYCTVSKKRKLAPTTATNVIQGHSKGFFYCLPNEIFHIILSLLSPKDIASLSLTSKQINTSIREYVFTVAGSRHILPDTPPLVTGSGHVLSALPFGDESRVDENAHANICDTVCKFASLGTLMKQLTMFQPIRSRLRVASFVLNKLEHTHQALIMFAGHSSAYFCFGRLLFAFVRGWEDYEKIKAYNLILTIAKLEYRVEKVLQSKPASLQLLERDIRLIHRRVFLDHAAKLGEREYGFWLTQILKPWPITFQARLLYLLTAPEDESGYISWTLVCGCSNLQHELGSVDFSELANSLRVLLELNSKDWSMDNIISIIDELTTTPNGWCLENVSQLLINCGKDISKGVLGCRASNGRVEELVVICFYLANACLMKDGYQQGSEENIRWFLDILRSTMGMLPNSTKRATFMGSLVDKWQDYLTALFEDSAPEDNENEEIQTEILSTLGNFTKLTYVLLQMVME